MVINTKIISIIVIAIMIVGGIYLFLPKPVPPVPPYNCDCNSEDYPEKVTNWSLFDTVSGSSILDSGDSQEWEYDLGIESGCYKVKFDITWLDAFSSEPSAMTIEYSLYDSSGTLKWNDLRKAHILSEEVGVFCWNNVRDWRFNMKHIDTDDGRYDFTISIYEWVD